MGCKIGLGLNTQSFDPIGATMSAQFQSSWLGQGMRRKAPARPPKKLKYTCHSPSMCIRRKESTLVIDLPSAAIQNVCLGLGRFPKVPDRGIISVKAVSQPSRRVPV